MLLRGLLPIAFLDDFLNTLAIDRQLLPRVLGHLLSNLNPVHSTYVQDTSGVVILKHQTVTVGWGL